MNQVTRFETCPPAPIAFHEYANLFPMMQGEGRMTHITHQRIRQYLARGWSYRMIAGALGVSVETVAQVAGA